MSSKRAVIDRIEGGECSLFWFAAPYAHRWGIALPILECLKKNTGHFFLWPIRLALVYVCIPRSHPPRIKARNYDGVKICPPLIPLPYTQQGATHGIGAHQIGAFSFQGGGGGSCHEKRLYTQRILTCDGPRYLALASGWMVVGWP